MIRTNTANRLRELPHCVKSVSGQKPQTFLSNYPTVEEDCNNYRKEKCFPPRAFEEEFKADFFFPVWFNMWTLASWLRSQGRKKKSENCIFLLDCDLNWKKKKLNETIKAMTGTNYHCCLTSDKQTNTANIKCVLHGLD